VNSVVAIKVRRTIEHGKTKLDWLSSSHGFSFGGYRNKDNIRFGKLIVFNDDVVKAGMGFGAHSHDNAEIFSFVLNGTLEHRDSAGNHGVLKEYEIQRISAGSGITHSEFNHSKDDEVHFLQIWLEPRTPNANPSYEQRSYLDIKGKKGIFRLISGTPGKETVYIDQDAGFYVGHLDGEAKKVSIAAKMGLYIYLLEGSITVDGLKVGIGDSVEITSVKQVEIESKKESRFVMLEVQL
jgi:redox-sensitive bicupin YhaK (pirin superfamily)